MFGLKNSAFRLFLALLLCLTAAPAACGKKASPKPPEITAPSPVAQLSAKGGTNGVTLGWLAPTTDARGEPLLDLSVFRVKRRNYAKEDRGRFSTVAELPVKTAGDTSGYGYVDEDVEPGKRYDYIVVPVNGDGVEGRSNYGLRVTFSGESSVVETF